MSGPSFTEKVLRVEVQMELGKAGSHQYDLPIDISGLRMAVSMQKNVFPSLGSAYVRIYGMRESIMNKCSTLGTVQNNTLGRGHVVTVFAGDTNGTAQIFQGNIWKAYQNLDDIPDTSFSFELTAGGFLTLNPVPPVSYRGPVDVAVVIEAICRRNNLGFENHGVSAIILHNPYFGGTVASQLQYCGLHANIDIEFANQIVIISPKTGGTSKKRILISPQTGLIGYPRYSSAGMSFRTLFNPNITFGVDVDIQTGAVGRANGIWRIRSVDYDLSCLIPNGPWFCDCSVVPPGIGSA